MGELAVIDRLVTRLGPPGGNLPDSGVALAAGDDAAAFASPAEGGAWPIVCLDTLVEGIHWDPRYSTPFDVGYKLLACNLSDVAAMGGQPGPYLLSLALPSPFDDRFVDALADGIERALRDHGLTPRDVALIGGDTTGARPEATTLSLVLFGRPCHGRRLLLRANGQGGDTLWVSGPLGGAAAGLALLAAGRSPDWGDALIGRHRRPRARLDLAPKLAASAGVHAVIDLSDGLATDLRHLARASGLSAELDPDGLPIDSATRRAAVELGSDPVAWALSGGEDFELLVSADPSERALLPELGCVEVGRLLDRGEAGTIWLVGEDQPLTSSGYEHG